MTVSPETILEGVTLEQGFYLLMFNGTASKVVMP